MTCNCGLEPVWPSAGQTLTVAAYDGSPIEPMPSRQFLSSILHELQQPLVAIQLFAAHGQRNCEAGEQSIEALRSHFEGIYDSAVLTLATIAQLRQLVNGQPTMFEPIDINHAVAEVIHLAEIVGRSRGVSIDHHLEPDLSDIQADRVSLQHAILNLLFNGIEANEGQVEGRVTIRTRSAGDAIEIVVADNGAGVAKKNRDRLFEPHFTTKPEGSGLGLGIARSILEHHGGTIDLERSKAGEGATFRLRLPLISARSTVS